MAKSKSRPADPVVAELLAIKQLLILGLMRDGVTQRQVAAALGLHESQLSRTLPKGLGAGLKNGRRESS